MFFCSLIRNYALPSQFKPLDRENAMAVRKLSQNEVLQDIRSGMDDAAIRKKYNLSDRGLLNLYEKLTQAGLLAHDFTTVTRRLNLVKILADVQAGLNESELMRKYELSEEALKQVSKKLLDARGKRTRAQGPETCIIEPTDLLATGEFVRHDVDFELPVYEANRPEIHGMVRDISEEGVSVEGIEAKEGDLKTLVILGDEFGEVSSFEFEGYCRWCFADPTDATVVSGFAIHKISERDRLELRKLIRVLTVGG
jgi:Mor family transcriptional regulator